MKARSERSGFTLMELLLAIAIVGILAAIATTSYRPWLPTSRVNGAAREIFSDLQLARMSAISENNDYVVIFDSSNNTYSIYDDDDNDFGASGVEPDELVKTVDIGYRYPGIGYGYVPGTMSPSGGPVTDELTFTGSPPRVAFAATGLSDRAGSIYIKPEEDSSRKDRQRVITVSIIGRVRMYRHTGSGWE